MATPQTAATIDIGNGPESLDVVSWSVKRELTGGALPAQVRAASGLSVGSGSVDVNVPDGRTPWTSTKVAPGGLVSLDATTDAGIATSPVARMVIREVGAGSALSTGRDVSIEDSLAGMRGLVTLPAVLSRSTASAPDAAYVIDRAARTGGRYATPEPVASAIFCLHACGSQFAEVTDTGQSVEVVSWLTDGNGQVYGVPGGTNASYGLARGGVLIGSSFYITLTLPNVAGASFSLLDPRAITIGQTVATVAQDFGTATTPTYTLGPDRRVQVQIELTSSAQTRIRARTSVTSWTAWGSSTAGTSFDFNGAFRIAPGSTVLGVQVHTADDPAVWAAPTARIAATGARLMATQSSNTSTAWETAQQVTQATLGALWLDESGTLVYRAKEALRGIGVTSAGTIDALTSVVDLPWSISVDDVADRVEVTYNPPDIQDDPTQSITAWTSTEVIAIGAGKTVTLTVALDAAIFTPAEWLSVTDSFQPAGRWSRWAASTQRDGGGVAPPTTALTVTSTLLNPSLVQIRITNNTAGTLYTAGTDASAQLTLRVSTIARPGEQITLSSGVDAVAARNPLTVDLGSWVQDAAAAQAVLTWLTSMTAQALPVLDNVQVVPDLNIRLGDVRVLRDPTITGLVAKVLVVGVDLSGSAGSLTQTLRLAVLGELEADMATLFTTASLATEGDVATYITTNLGGSVTEADAGEWLEGQAVA